MVSAEDVIGVYKFLSSHGIQVWLTGGWGIDALLGEQTRPHHDLDVFMLVDDVNRLLELMGQSGYTYKELWSENLTTVDTLGVETDTGFFLRDAHGREFDAHALRLDARGNGIPAWEMPKGFIFSPQYLSGEGTVAGYPVRCTSAEYQMVSHTGYPLPEKQVPDLRRLHEKFRVAYPEKLFQVENKTGLIDTPE